MRLAFLTLLSALHFSSTLSFAQHTLSNEQKYWQYRERLKNDFLVVGDCMGCSIPASIRHLSNSYVLKWGDATIDLGWYIGVLATEYRLLKNENKDVTETIKELHFALDAFNRLDLNAESYWRCRECLPTPQPNDLNGFFIRDDVPGLQNTQFGGDFVQQHPNLIKPTVASREVQFVDSDFHNIGPVEETHDQVWHLLMGLTLTTYFVDSTATYGETFKYGSDENIYIRKEALAIIDRIFSHIKNNGYAIKNPAVGNQCIIGVVCSEKERTKHCDLNLFSIIDNCGANAGWLAYGAAEAANFAVSNFYTKAECIPASEGYHSARSKYNGPYWHLYGLLNGSLNANFPAGFDKILMLASLGSSWYLTPYINYTPLFLYYPSAAEGYEHFPLLHKVLHGGVNLIGDEYYEMLINCAPDCGPYNFGGTNFPNYEWSSSFRFRFPENRGNGGNPLTGEYNGLDFMLLYNLFALSKQK